MTTIEEKFNILIEKISGLETKIDENMKKQEEEIRDIKSKFSEFTIDIQNFREREKNIIRKRNIIIFGLDRENISEMNNVIMEVLKYIIPNFRPYDITEIRKINPKNKNGPIIVKLNSLFLKKDIMKNKFKLAKSDTFKTIKIKDDLPKSVRDIRKELFPFMKTHWEKGNKATLRYDKLLINDQLFSLEQLQSQETFKKKRERSEEKDKEEIAKNVCNKPEPTSKGKRLKDNKAHHRSISLDKFFITHKEENKEMNNKEPPGTSS